MLGQPQFASVPCDAARLTRTMARGCRVCRSCASPRPGALRYCLRYLLRNSLRYLLCCSLRNRLGYCLRYFPRHCLCYSRRYPPSSPRAELTQVCVAGAQTAAGDERDEHSGADREGARGEGGEAGAGAGGGGGGRGGGRAGGVRGDGEGAGGDGRGGDTRAREQPAVAVQVSRRRC
eukprot:3938426-Rhodomonas_salina.5